MRKITALFLALAFCAGFWACNGETVITEDSLEGTWVTAAEPQNLNRYTEYRFDGDGKGSYRIYQDGEGSDRIDFTYSLKDRVLSLVVDGDTTEYETVYNGEALVLTHNKETISLTKENK